MSLKNRYALVRATRAGRNINVDNSSSFVFNTSVEIGSAFAYSYCVKYLLTGIF